MKLKAMGFLLLLGSTAIVNACLMSKPLEAEVRISLSEQVAVNISKDLGASYIDAYSEDDYKKIFFDELKRLLALEKIVVDNTNPQFSISITQLALQEKLSADTVKDERSPDHGKVFRITEGLVSANGTLTNVTNQKTINWTATKDKRERITSMQSLGQMVTGDNKNLTEYRKKEFDKTEFYALAGQCGQKAAAVIASNIKKQMK